MKKILLILLACFLVTGCTKYNESGIIKTLDKKLEKAEGYKLKGELTINNGDDKFVYDVDVSYKKPNYFRVSLKNKANNHNQIILKNKDGVYVLTPSLNKSFKFQSDWPYNNSQIYLLQTLLTDIQNDEDRTFKKSNSDYIYTTKVNYSNNSSLVKQKVYFNNKIKPTKVVIYDNDNNIQMKMVFSKTDLNATFEKNYFNLDENMKVSKSIEETEAVSKIDTIIYPVFLPENTKLSSQNSVDLKNGERVILTFSGDNPFSLIQETTTKDENSTTIPVSGEPYMLAEGVGVLYEDSISWTNQGIDYYIVSSSLSTEELITVANSVSIVSAQK